MMNTIAVICRMDPATTAKLPWVARIGWLHVFNFATVREAADFILDHPEATRITFRMSHAA